MCQMMQWIYFLLIFIGLFFSSKGWTTDELDMFDLLDEIDGTFYDFMGLDQSASSSDIRRKYRELSRHIHPDKIEDDPKAVKFRQLVRVYNVLKNKELRSEYDDILINGPPDWRMRVFYRKLRKMSGIELGLIFSVLLTVIHYAFIWGTRYERVWLMKSQLSSSMKRHKARDQKLAIIDQKIAEALKIIPPLVWHDLLPFAICKWIYYFVLAIPILFHEFVYKKIMQMFEDRKIQKEIKQQTKARMLKREKLQKSSIQPDEAVAKITSPFNLADLPLMSSESTESLPECANTESSEWTAEDLKNLVRAVSKYPGGTPGRWNRIAQSVDRPVKEVIAKAKSIGESNIRSSFMEAQHSVNVTAFETNENAVCGESSDESNDERTAATDSDGFGDFERVDVIDERESSTEVIINDTDNDDQPYLSRKKLKQLKSATNSESKVRHRTSAVGGPDDQQQPMDATAPTDSWSQAEQRQLELAIKSFPKDTIDRWDRIAECVPGKTKIEVINRTKELSAKFKSKQSEN